MLFTVTLSAPLALPMSFVGLSDSFLIAYAKALTPSCMLIEGLVIYLTGGTTLKYKPEGKDEVYNLEFKRPWKRYDMIETLEEKLGVKFPPSDQLHNEETNQFLKDLCKKHNVDCSEPRTNPRLLDKVHICLF